MPEITANVKFEHVAREWRFKWSADSDKAALTAAQAALEPVLVDLSSLEGVKSVQRVVCGGCFDFKVVTKLSAEGFGAWEKAGFAPERDFLAAVGKIAGVTGVETQTYTLEEVMLTKKQLKSAEKEQSKKAAKEAEAAPAVEKTPEELAADRKAQLKKVIKEGGKRGVEIEGAADMGGLQFFCTAVDCPEGDADLLEQSMAAMNAKSDPSEEERKGGSGHIGKMIFSAGVEQLAVVAYVPEAKAGELDCEEWLAKVLASQGGEVLKGGKQVSVGCVKTNSDKGVFPLKIREPMILEANNFLRKKGLFPDDNSDDDEFVFGDDDFPS